MPFESEVQRRYLWMHQPVLAKRWADKYGTSENLPKHKIKLKHSRKKK